MGATSRDLSTVGGRIRHMRERLGVSQQVVADWADVHAKTVSRWENNVQPPEIEALERLAPRFGVPIAWLRGSATVTVRGPSTGMELLRRDDEDRLLLASLEDSARLLRLRLDGEDGAAVPRPTRKPRPPRTKRA